MKTEARGADGQDREKSLEAETGNGSRNEGERSFPRPAFWIFPTLCREWVLAKWLFFCPHALRPSVWLPRAEWVRAGPSTSQATSGGAGEQGKDSGPQAYTGAFKQKVNLDNGAGGHAIPSTGHLGKLEE